MSIPKAVFFWQDLVWTMLKFKYYNIQLWIASLITYSGRVMVSSCSLLRILDFPFILFLTLLKISSLECLTLHSSAYLSASSSLLSTESIRDELSPILIVSYSLFVKIIGEFVVVISSSISANLFLKSDTGLIFIVIHLLFLS